MNASVRRDELFGIFQKLHSSMFLFYHIDNFLSIGFGRFLVWNPPTVFVIFLSILHNRSDFSWISSLKLRRFTVAPGWIPTHLLDHMRVLRMKIRLAGCAC